VNIITKKPQATPLTQFETRGTTNASDFSRVRGGDFSFDSTGPLGAGDRVLYRVIGQLSDDRYFRDLSYLRGQYIAPSMSFKLGTATIATIQFEYRKASADYDNVELLAPDTAVAATVAQLAPIHTNYAAPGTSRDERGTSTTVFLDHGFSGGAVWHLDMRSVDHHDYATAYDIGPFDKADPTLQTLDLRARGQSNQRTYNFADSNVVVPFLTGSVAHRVIFGLNYGKEIDDFKRRQFCTLNTLTKRDPKCDPTTTPHTIAVINPDFSIVPSLATFGPGSLADNYIVSQTEAAYVSDLLTLTDHWKSFLGLRYSHDKVTANINSYDPTQPYYSQTRSSTVPAVGLIFQPDSHWSYYASYTTSYSPVDPSTTAPTTAPTFKPVEGKGEEVGVKANFMNGRLDFTGALFRIDEKNILAPYPGGTDQFCPTGSCSIQVGGARSKGVELELNAKPIDALTLIAGYAYTDARVTDSTAGGPLVGHQLPNSPLNAAHLWARYDVLDGLMRGFGAGLGFSAVSARVAMTGTSTLPGEFILPSYQVVDLGLYKVFSQHLDLTLKINNVFDKLYYQSGKITSGMVNVSAGLPRTIELYLHASF
ncbi:MAG: TonB-dependent siderophore receptor, partial [Vulcanimicrobiaceae bacterium]